MLSVYDNPCCQATHILAASACFSREKQAAQGDGTPKWSKRPTWHKEAKWPEIKAAWLQWYVRCQDMEVPNQKAMLSWGRTFALCAALCVVGIVLRVKLDEQMSVSRIWSSFIHSHSVSTQTLQQKPSLGKASVVIGR